MRTIDRRLLEQIIKQWAQDHTTDFIIADYDLTSDAMENTQGYFTWLIQTQSLTINLVELANRIEEFLESRRNRKHPDGLVCKKCRDFYEFAEPNQEDGTLICYSCRTKP